MDGCTCARREPGVYDALLLDAFSIGGRIPFHLVSREFIALCRDRLAPGGVFVMNINSAMVGPQAGIFRSMYKTIESVFPKSTHAFCVNQGQIGRDQSTNIILVGINRDQPISADDWTAAAANYNSASYIGRAEIERMLDDLVVTLPDVSEAPIFTDDYAPIETMAF